MSNDSIVPMHENSATISSCLASIPLSSIRQALPDKAIQSLSARRDFSGLEKSDKTLWFPCPIYIFFNGRVANIFSDHFQEMILPLFVHHLLGDVRDRQPMAVFINSTCGHEYMKVRIVGGVNANAAMKLLRNLVR